MTAIPSSTPGVAPGDRDLSDLVLICDGCGRTFRHDERGWDLLWSSAQGAGWRGRDRAVGPHFCSWCGAA
ncbi:hypothetical protein [Saccharothrix coeruleofusca]|uniref:Uncharacterized protein n=1 Tax=Saccharothrix coeruleofusca TaxID=33919 RepID=A0A918AVY6_9PSEU|nr:hypothetical protein [Saccharothrix coeruleofusca]MBP2336744.1 hypothetical protein [Saccharothrix coeruleofusca]GGP78357.1 hypothetical protein GCM10010185_60120 [Saccharothrix coeruleofusca]